MKTTVIFFGLLLFSVLSFSQAKTESKCQLWTPNSLCDLPRQLNIPCQVEGRDCYWNYLSCEEIAKKGSLKGIKITFISKTDSVFSLSSKFINLSLKNRSTGKTLHPSAILWHNDKINSTTNKSEDVLEYMTDKFKVKEYLVKIKPGVAYDLILLFKEAETGDTFMIDNFMDVKVGG
jgi:hypothetical protein